MKLYYWMLLLPAVASAAEPTLQQCRVLPDPAARLACYDALPLPANPAVIATPAPAPAPEPPARFGLANGQVWQVADGSTRFYDLDNPKVTIRRGMLGAFYLDLSVDNWSIRVR